MPKYWINTVSVDHVRAGVEGGFTQANHGRPTRLRQLARGDLVVFYSPRTRYPDPEPLQRFTALGRVVDDAPYQAEMIPTVRPWRRRVQFIECQEAPIQHLIGELTFIKDRTRRASSFDGGYSRLARKTSSAIARAMQVDLDNA
jgi:hypothetical protein